MLTVERRNLILKLLDEQSVLSVNELSGHLGVSEVTVRKMLNTLARQGLLRRTHGGAVSLSVPVRESDLRTKEKTNISLKKDISRRAYELIRDHDTVFLDAGSTTLELAKQIRNGPKRNVTIITNALNIALALLDSYDLSVLVVGGRLRHDVVSCVGPLAERALRTLYFDKAFIAANRFSLEQGASTPQLVEGQFKTEAMKSAGLKYLLCDSSKYGSAAMARIAPLTDFDGVITDADLPAEARQDLVAAGVKLIVSEPRAF